MRRLLWFAALILLLPSPVAAQDKTLEDPVLAMKRIRVPEGTRLELFAADPLVVQPAAFCIDEHNRLYVAESAYQRPGETERLRLLEDSKGSGQADRATLLSDEFKHGSGLSVLVRHGTLWYACSPDLWQLPLERPRVRKIFLTGFGGDLGHGVHGLCLGPDGKLYFSCGSGLNVVSGGHTLSTRNYGVVLRCNLDGSDLELFAVGLRNPYALVFDQFGNLFTGDSNDTGDDKARWIHVVEGGDSGWRGDSERTWRAEGLWDPTLAAQVAWMVPPVATLSGGLFGAAYEPGAAALPARYREHFFLAHFRGGLQAFALKPKGASFELVDLHYAVATDRSTDVHFGTDGALYFCDFMAGSGGIPGKGRIYRVYDPVLAQEPRVLEVKKLLADGLAQRPAAELAQLLEHADMRVRLEAQFALAEKGDESIATFRRVAQDSRQRLARLHAVWGLGQIGRRAPAALQALLPLVGDPDSEVRAQVARVLGDGKLETAYQPLLGLLRDPEARVRFFAAQGLGKLGKAAATLALFQMLRDNADQDPYLRHAGVVALARLDDRPALLAAARDDSAAVRLAVLLALRRLESSEVARFLDDRDPRLVLEAARAIHDVPLTPALAALAALLDRPNLPPTVLFRVVDANARVGRPENVRALLAFAERGTAPEGQRLEAIRQVGLLAAALRMPDVGPVLRKMATDQRTSSPARIAILQALTHLKDKELPEALKWALAADDPRLRAAGLRLQARLQGKEALPRLQAALSKGEIVERQAALAALGELKGDEVDEVLSAWLGKLLLQEVPGEIQLDLLEAAGPRPAPTIRKQLAQFEAARGKNDPLARYRETLTGGDAEAGRDLFFHKSDVSCVRCHKVHGDGGEVGPELAGIGARQGREYLLESIVYPNRQIAKGYETVVLTLTTGQTVSGIVKTEDGKEVRLVTPEGRILTVARNRIEERRSGKSAMPEDLVNHLSKRELRDLVEFLASLKE